METQAIGYFLSPQQSLAWLGQQNAGRQLLTQAAVLIESNPNGRELDAARLERALGELVLRHEALRTAFRRRAGMKIPFQVILDGARFAWETAGAPSTDSATAAEAMLAGQAKLPFNLEQGPLVRALLGELSSDRHILVLTAPAVCADGASMSALVRELFDVYGNGASKPAGESIDEPLRYVQFAQWQSELLEESDDDAAVAGKKFWQERAESGEQQVELPGETAADSPGQADVVPVRLPAAIERQAQSLAAAAKGTNREVLLAAWQSLLSRLTGRARLAVGVTLAGREYAELAGTIGLIAKMVPIHARFEGNPTFLEAVEQAKAAIEEAAGVQEYFDPAGAFSPDAAIAFLYTEAPAPIDMAGVADVAGAAGAAGLRVSTLGQKCEIAPSKLRLNCVEAGGALELRFEFDSARYERDFVEQLAKRFMILLAAGVENPKQQVARLALLDEAETARQVYEWNATDAPYPARTMHSLIEEQARRTPDRMAVRCEDRAMSYAELNRRANRLAHHLRSLGVGAGSPVGLCVMRSEQMIVAVLGIHKAGGAYVPLSADYPPARLAQQLEGARALITEDELKAKMPERWGEAAAGPVLSLDGDAENWAGAPETDPDAGATPEDLAYVIYTSGSTGQPKGVGVRHRNLVNYSWAIAQRLKLADYPGGLEFATVSTLLADLGNTCIYPALVSGGGLHVIPYEVSTDAAQMAAYQAKYPIDVLKIVPSHLAALLASPDGAKILPRRFLITGGEALTWGLVAEIEAGGAGCELINHYGPTETTVGSLMQPVKDLDRARAPKLTVPIGRPIANTQAYVLDAQLEPVPEGVTGELYISGAGVSAGYVGQPKLTAERFLANPFVPGATMYKTGDLVRFVPGTSGAIEFLGRADDQVKVRGFRIELGEIEAALLKQPGVRQAVVLARQDAGGTDKQLVGYVVASAGEQVTGEQLRRQLRELLPDYMVPTAVILLEKLPLTANGKIDRNALPEADAASFERPYIAPATPTEQAIAVIWQEVLHRPEVSSDANFFELGGHSLTATQVISRIRQHFSVGIALRTLFESPVLKALAEAVDAAAPVSKTAASPIKRAARDAYRVTAE